MVAMFGIFKILLVFDPFYFSDQAYHFASLYPYHLSLFFFFLLVPEYFCGPLDP